ncbi:MAG TPA: biotin--[acetyl-CoA-carboxylase] ligase, partial [Vicinamibacteria bacterium]|nr:biotin--[acetyl-CoA-carboxylase] ligase [Vicinamibacteria bacterium]
MATLSPGPADYERALAAAGLSDITVFHRQSTGSTNDDARSIAAIGLPLLESAVAIVVAETQTKGRGRGSNAWFSPQGSIALTITVPGVDAGRLGVLPLGVGAAVAGALRDLGAPALVKWPNDVLIEGAKVCGILCESSLLAGTARVFAGIGINVEPASVDPAALPGATTLGNHGVAADRPSLVADLTARVLALVRGDASSARIVEGWKAVAVPWWGEEVTLVDGDAERRVTLLDVNPEGQLVVRDEGGAIRSLVSGE